MPVIVGPGDPGTTVSLTSIWFNVADDLADSISFHRPVDAIAKTITADVEVRSMASGRRRAVRTGPGVATSWSVSLPRCTRDEAAWLEDHVGVLVCVRDHVGTKVFGIYRELPTDISAQYRDRISAKLTIESVTHSEAV